MALAGGGALPTTQGMMTGALQNDYATLVAELTAQMTLQAQQLSMMGASLGMVQADVANILGTALTIEGNSNASMEITQRMRSAMQEITDKGVVMR